MASSSRAASSIYPSILQASKSSLKRKHAFGIAGEPGKFSKAASIDVRKVVKFSNNVHTFPTVLGRKRSSIGELQLKRPIKKSKPPVQTKSRVDSIKKELLTPSQQRSIGVTYPADKETAKNIKDIEPVLKTTTTTRKTKLRQRKKGGSIERKAAEIDQAASPPPPARRKKLKKLRIKSGGSLVRQPLALGAVYCRAPPRLAYSIQPNRTTRLKVIRDTDRKSIIHKQLGAHKKHFPDIKYKHHG